MAKKKPTPETSCVATIEETLEKVTSSARTNHDPECRMLIADAQLPIGKCIRQGDVYLKRYPLGHFGDLKANDTRQVAAGDSIGSRHICREEKGAQVLARKEGTILQGPIIRAPEGFYLEHPKHGDVDCHLAGDYECTFPRDLASEELARIRD